jgi:hypothetical protein
MPTRWGRAKGGVGVTAEGDRVAGFGRLEDGLRQASPWYMWGPYVSERQWGTVREDYSEDGDAWNYLPHDYARSRAYRWARTGSPGSATSTSGANSELRAVGARSVPLCWPLFSHALSSSPRFSFTPCIGASRAASSSVRHCSSWRRSASRLRPRKTVRDASCRLRRMMYRDHTEA